MQRLLNKRVNHALEMLLDLTKQSVVDEECKFRNERQKQSGCDPPLYFGPTGHNDPCECESYKNDLHDCFQTASFMLTNSYLFEMNHKDRTTMFHYIITMNLLES